jgi:hypothetical protein
VNTYVAVGNKEDISDLITNIAPDETPMLKMVGTGKAADATYVEWLEDDLPAASDNKQVEGAEFTVIDPGTRARYGNYTQIMSHGYKVTGTQEVVGKHGLTSEIAYQMRKSMKKLALDQERALILNVTASAGTADTAREMGGFQYFVSTNVLANGAITRVIDEVLLNDALEQAWNAGGNPDTVLVSGGNKRIISGWSTNMNRQMSQTDTKLTRRLDVYESDFGLVKIVVDRWMPDDKIFIADSQYLETRPLRPFKKHDLPKTGDSLKQVIVGELTFVCRAEKAHAIISDLALV